MTAAPAQSRLAQRLQSALAGSARHRTPAAIVISAAVLALAAACSSGSPAAHRASSPGAQASPHQVMTLAAAVAQQVNSVTGSASVQLGTADSASGTLALQVKPSLLLSENLTASANGQPETIGLILTSSAVYLNIPALSQQAGAPWTEIPFSELPASSGSAVSEIIEQVQSGNPLVQTQLMAASTGVHAVGSAVISGVQTTEYAGSVSPAAAANALSPSLSSQLGPQLKLISGDISWTAWLDSQHMLRKLTEHQTVAGQPATLSVTITSVNKPVSITVPAAGQVSILPPSALSSTGQ